MGILITDELMDFYAEEYRAKLGKGEIKNINFKDYLDIMVKSVNLNLGYLDEYLKKLGIEEG